MDFDFGGMPPSGYVCNRCGEKGHFLQACPTNLDPSYDNPPAPTYVCEICKEKGSHFKSLCPHNKDPYSIFQKRKKLGIKTPYSTPGNKSVILGQWEREAEAKHESEGMRFGRGGGDLERVNTPGLHRNRLEPGRLSRDPFDYGPSDWESTGQDMEGQDHVENDHSAHLREPAEDPETFAGSSPIGSNNSMPGGYSDLSYRQPREINNQDAKMAGYEIDAANEDENYPTTEKTKATAKKTKATAKKTKATDEKTKENKAPGNKDSTNLSPFIQSLMRRHPMTDQVNPLPKRMTALDMWELDAKRLEEKEKEKNKGS